MTDSRVTPQAAAAAAQVVRELFGYGCQHGRMAVTLDYVPCGQCDDCTHDWSPEAKAILAAAVPLLCQPLQDEIDRLWAVLAQLGAMHYEDGKVNCAGPVCSYCGDSWSSGVGAVPRGCLTVQIVDDALAAVPVGTGGAE